MSNDNDPLSNLWQSQNLSLSVDKIMAEAKKRKRRMFVLMATDLIVWLALVVWGCWLIHLNEHPHSFVLGTVLILTVSIATGFTLWLRAATWGGDSLDVKNTIRLSIHRCEAAISMTNMAIYFTALILAGMIGLDMFTDAITEEKRTFLYGYLSAYLVLTLVVGRWYKLRQKKRMKELDQTLAQLEQAATEG